LTITRSFKVQLFEMLARFVCPENCKPSTVLPGRTRSVRLRKSESKSTTTFKHMKTRDAVLPGRTGSVRPSAVYENIELQSNLEARDAVLPGRTGSVRPGKNVRSVK